MGTATPLPTIRDVAARAQVSICTASTILNRQDRRALYSDHTQARVQAAAESLGYVPNHRGRALQSRRTQAIGVIAPLMRDPFTAAMVAAVDRAIRERHHHTVLLASDDDARTQDGLSALGAGRVDALLALHSAMRAPEIDRLESCSGRVVLLLPRQRSRLPSVVVQPQAGIAEAVSHLAGLGHRPNAWLGPDDDAIVESAARVQAAQAAARERGLELRQWVMRETPPQTEEWIAAARAATVAGCASAPATAALCYNDLCALGAYGAAAELGLRVGRELSLVGYDDIHGSITSPPMTSISHRLDAAAEAALSLLLDDPRPASGALRALDSRLVVRASTAPPLAR